MKSAIEIIKSLKDLLLESVSGRPVNVAKYNGEISKAAAFIAEHENEHVISLLSIKLLQGDSAGHFHIESRFYGDEDGIIAAIVRMSQESDEMSKLIRKIMREVSSNEILFFLNT